MRKFNIPLSVVILFAALLSHAQEVRLPLEKDSLRFAVIGDNGTGDKPEYDIGGKLAAVHAMWPFDFVLMMGDNLYGGEAPRDFQNKFEKPYQALLSSGVKFYATLGNHDDPARQVPYKPFNMGGKHYYTFKPKEGVRFFSLDSNYMDKTQLDWFEKELKSSGSEWKIVFFHHPIYSSGLRHGSNLELRSVLEPLMVKYGVDVVMSPGDETPLPAFPVFHHGLQRTTAQRKYRKDGAYGKRVRPGQRFHARHDCGRRDVVPGDFASGTNRRFRHDSPRRKSDKSHDIAVTRQFPS